MSKVNEIRCLIYNSSINDELSNEDLVQIIELSLDFLNAKTISNYAKDNNLSYNGVKKCRKTIEIRGVKFVIDNE